MFVPRIRTAALALAAGLSLSACVYDDGYGYGGVSVGYGAGYGGYYDDYYDPYYGGGHYSSGYGYGYPRYSGYSGLWYNNFYYPGTGYYVFDRGGRRYRWNDDQRRYFEGRNYRIRDREDRQDFRQFRREGRQDFREYRQESRDAIQRFRRGEITRDQLQNELRGERREYRQDRRQDRREFRRDLRDRPGTGVVNSQRQQMRQERQQMRMERRQQRQERRQNRGG